MRKPTRQEVLERWGPTCAVCGDPIGIRDKWDSGHIIDNKFKALFPAGQLDSIENLRPMHHACNQPFWKGHHATAKAFWAWQKKAAPELRKFRLDGMMCGTSSASPRPDGTDKSHANLPYGYTYDDQSKRIRPDPREAQVVKVVLKLLGAGVPVSVIAARLNAEEIPTSKGGTWGSGQVNTIRDNRHYIGGVIYGVPCPPLVSARVFEKAQAAKDLGRKGVGGPSCESEPELLPDQDGVGCVSCGGEVKDSRCLRCRFWQLVCSTCHGPTAGRNKIDKACSKPCQTARRKSGLSPWKMVSHDS